MRVGDNFASKENLDERICKAYTDGINEDITRLKSEGFRADFVVGNELPKKRPTWIVFSMHGLVCLKIDELQVISFDVYLSAKLFLDWLAELLEWHLRSGIYQKSVILEHFLVLECF